MAAKSSIITLPDDFHLLPGETLLKEKTVYQPMRKFDKVPSSLKQMQRLTASRFPYSIGRNGPSIASLALEDMRSNKFAIQSLALLKNNFRSQNTPGHLRLYEAVYGRDSLRVAIDLLSSYPELARTTIIKLAEMQGTEFNTEREEEPGKILHEAREQDDEMARKLTTVRGWGWPYYGSVDATPEFIRTLTAYCRLSEENYDFLSYTYKDKNGITRSIAYALDIALEWILGKLDSNQECLLEYKSFLPREDYPNPRGIENQVWKDSPDAYHHEDGTLANHKQGVASIEVQVTTFDALIDAAELYERMYDDKTQADIFRKKADELKEAIFEYFWTDEKGGYFVLGTDRDAKGKLRPMKIRTSNMGHALNSRLLEGNESDIVKKREAIIKHLLSPELLNISGIRTLATDEIRFRPGAYHNGSVWLWDTHHIAKGFRRHGYHDIANELDRRMLHVVETTKMFPEYVRGDTWILPRINEYTITVWDDEMRRENYIEQPPQEVQAWTVAAILATKKRIDRNQKRQNPFEAFSDSLVKSLRLQDWLPGLK